MIAHVCGCNASDSVALLQCLRAKSSEELLDINKVKRGRRVWGQTNPTPLLLTLIGTLERRRLGFIVMAVEARGRIYRTLIGNVKELDGPGVLLSLQKIQENMKVVSKSLGRGTALLPHAARN